MVVVLKDISKARWHETGGIPVDNLIDNISALADDVNVAIPSNPPAGNNKKITNMYFNEDTGLPEFEVEA